MIKAGWLFLLKQVIIYSSCINGGTCPISVLPSCNVMNIEKIYEGDLICIIYRKNVFSNILQFQHTWQVLKCSCIGLVTCDVIEGKCCECSYMDGKHSFYPVVM